MPNTLQLLIATLVISSLASVAMSQKRNYPPVIEGAESHVYKTIDDVELKLFVFSPEEAETPRPAIVFFFGGGWRSGSPSQFVPHCRYLAERGMVAMVADYRVSERHGVKPMDCVRDAKSAIRWVRAHAKELNVDPNRIVAGGGSAGGHLAAATGLVPGFEERGEDPTISSQPNALALFNPAVMLAPYEGQDFWDEERRERIYEVTDGQPEAISPLHHIREGVAPTIIFHGDADTTVSVESVRLFRKLMDEQGNRCELKEYEGQPHGFFNFGRGKNAKEDGGEMYQQTLAALDEFLVSLSYLPALENTEVSSTDALREGLTVRARQVAWTGLKQRLQAGEAVHVAFMGGSITEMNGYRPIVCERLQARFPKARFTFTNAGISSTCSHTGAFRLRDDVLSQGPVDLFFVEFAVNDDQDAAHAKKAAMMGMEGVIRQTLKHNPKAMIVMVHFANPSLLELAGQGKRSVSIQAHEAVAQHYGISSVNIPVVLSKLIETEEMTWKEYGGTHPKKPGNTLAAELCLELLDAPSSSMESPTLPEPKLIAESFTNGRWIDVAEAKKLDRFAVKVPDWKTLPGSKRERYTSLKLLCGDQPGASCELEFAGTAIGAFVLAGPDAGRVDYRIDGGAWETIDFYHHYSKGLHYPRTVMFATGLEPSEHRIELKVSEETSSPMGGHAVRIVSFGIESGEDSLSGTP